MSEQVSHSKNSVQKWSVLSRVFHWGSAVLLLVTWAMILLHENADSSRFIILHKAFGVSLLFWMLARIINRIFTKAPPALVMPKWQIGISHLTHFALYALLLAMPIAGLLSSLYGGRPVSMFGLFDIPVFVEINRGLARSFNDAHVDIIWPLLIVFTLLHIAAALYHQFVQKDNLIARMK